MKYIARTLHGLEERSWMDIRDHGGSVLQQLSHRTIEFESEADPIELLAVRGIEDLFVHIATIDELTHERAALQTLRKHLQKVSLVKALATIRSLRSLPATPSYSITASFVGARNYNRWELADTIRGALRELDALPYVETRNQSAAPHDLNLRLIIEAEKGILGLRISDRPLHKREYLIHHVPASISPVAAYLMVKEAALRAGEVLLDPLCGGGTIPIEASYYSPHAVVMGIEADQTIAAYAQKNAMAAGTGVSIASGNVFTCALEPHSVDVIVSDLPWGEQTTLIGGDYNRLLKNCAGLLRSGGRVVLMSGAKEDLVEALKGNGFTIDGEFSVSLHGKHPAIVSAHVA